jgi:histidinol-phosphate/aromatic aminotransferase/cobyric acid decarboxylase-like protein
MLRALKGVREVYDSGGNFLLVRCDPHVYPSPQIVTELLARHAIYVKDVTERIDDGDTFLRLAVRSPADHRDLIDALNALAY